MTQFECVGCVERSSEAFRLPVLENLLEACPCRILGWNADNGSESSNHQVARLLEKLRVEEFPQSRPRRSHDNALAESAHYHRVCLNAEERTDQQGQVVTSLPA